MKKEFIKVRFDELFFDPKNVRILHITNDRNDWGHDEIRDHFLHGDGKVKVKKLMEKIVDANQLYEPITVVGEEGDYKVIEGNQRLAAHLMIDEINYKKNGEKFRPNGWPDIECIWFKDVTAKEVEHYLYTVHVEGKDEWAKYNKALSLKNKLNENFTIEEIAKSYRKSKDSVEADINTINMIDNHNLLHTKFSIVNWYIKNRALRIIFKTEKVNKEKFEESFIKCIKQDSEGKDSVTVRNVLSAVAKNALYPLLKKFSEDANFAQLKNTWNNHPVSTSAIETLKTIQLKFRDKDFEKDLYKIIKTKSNDHKIKEKKDEIKKELDRIRKKVNIRLRDLEKFR